MPAGDRSTSRGRLTVLYDQDCGLCTATAAVLARLDRRGRLALVPLSAAAHPGQPALDELVESIHAVDADGRWWVGADAWLEICRRVTPLLPLVWLARVPFGRLLMDVAYRLVARHRGRLGRLLGLDRCRR